MNKIIITKKIAKQGKNSIIVIPSCLRGMLQPGSVVKVEITNLQLNKKRKIKNKNGRTG